MLRDLARIAAALKQDFAGFLDHNGLSLLALRMGLACAAAVLIACWLQLDNPWWAGISVFGVTQSRPRATLRRAFDRALGTLGGAVAGFFAAAFLYDHGLLALILLASTAFSLYAQERSDHGYAVMLGGVTLILVVFGSLVQPEESLNLAVFRALEVLVGIAVSVFFEMAFAGYEPKPAALPSGKPGIWARPLDLPSLGAALSGGLAIVSIPIVWNAFELPGMAQTPVTAFVIMTALHDDPTFKAISRAVGCVLGGAYGLLVLGLVGDAFLPWVVLMFVGFYAAARVKNGPSDASYVGHQAGIAMLLAMVQGAAASPDIMPAINRITGIFGGTLLIAAFQIAVTPLLVRGLLWLNGRPPLPANR